MRAGLLNGKNETDNNNVKQQFEHPQPSYHYLDLTNQTPNTKSKIIIMLIYRFRSVLNTCSQDSHPLH